MNINSNMFIIEKGFRKKRIADVNIPIIKLMYVDYTPTYTGAIYTLSDVYGLRQYEIDSSSLGVGISLSSNDSFPQDIKFGFRDIQLFPEDCVDCRIYKSLKDSGLSPKKYGTIGHASCASTTAMCSFSDYNNMRKGTRNKYLVLLYGYIPKGAFYYEIKPYNKFFNYVTRVVASEISLLPLNEQIKVTELTGYKELYDYLNK